MNGEIIYRPDVDHRCQPPRFEPFGSGGVPVGTAWRCDTCGRVYRVRWVRAQDHGATRVVAHPEWRRETRRQRRQRLGLRWWQWPAWEDL